MMGENICKSPIWEGAIIQKKYFLKNFLELNNKKIYPVSKNRKKGLNPLLWRACTNVNELMKRCSILVISEMQNHSKIPFHIHLDGYN